MSTSASVIFIDKGTPVATVTVTNDGYPKYPGIGWELYNILKDRKFVNGFGSDDRAFEVSNGVEDLAALFVARLKAASPSSRPGMVYLETPPDTSMPGKIGKLFADMDYTYEVRLEEARKDEPYICIILHEGAKGGEETFRGNVLEFGKEMDHTFFPDCSLANTPKGPDMGEILRGVTFGGLEDLVVAWANAEKRIPFSKWLEKEYARLGGSLAVDGDNRPRQPMFRIAAKDASWFDAMAARFRLEALGDMTTLAEWLDESGFIGPDKTILRAVLPQEGASAPKP